MGLPQRQVGLCFPSYKRIAAAAHCAPSTVGEAISALEAAGLLEWVNRIKRVREWMPGLPGVGVTRVRVVRTSNAYSFRDPKSLPRLLKPIFRWQPQTKGLFLFLQATRRFRRGSARGSLGRCRGLTTRSEPASWRNRPLNALRALGPRFGLRPGDGTSAPTVVGGHARRQGVRRQSCYVETLIAHHNLMMSKSGRGVEMETDHAPALPHGL